MVTQTISPNKQQDYHKSPDWNREFQS